MSADNYHLVDQRADGTYVVLANLSASVDYGKRALNQMRPRWSGTDYGQALIAAHDLELHEWTEYGVTISERARRGASSPSGYPRRETV